MKNGCNRISIRLLKSQEAEGTPQKQITDVDYADDIALLVNTPNQAETLLHSLEWATAGIGLHVNAHKTEFMCFNQKGDISTLDGTSLKLVDKFTCWTGLGSNTPHGANCTATYHLSWKLYKLDELDMPDTAGEAKTRS